MGSLSTVDEQRKTILELETPVIQIWDGVLAFPLVGSVDTRRAQTMNERLSERIVETGAEFVLVDISGVPVVDNTVSRHLLETVAAARLLGSEVIIVGLGAATAMTLVQLGESLSGVNTRTTMAKGLQLALKQLGYTVSRDAPRSDQATSKG